MDEHSPLTSTLESQKWSSHAIDQRCMLDFMNLICEQITAGIDSKHGVSWKNATIQWIFSVPGSWAELPTVANSKRLAEDAIYRCIGERPGSKVFTSPTETRASAHCLLKNGSVSAITAYAPGNFVLSCDIGGATTLQYLELKLLSSSIHPYNWIFIPREALLLTDYLSSMFGRSSKLPVLISRGKLLSKSPGNSSMTLKRRSRPEVKTSGSLSTFPLAARSVAGVLQKMQCRLKQGYLKRWRIS